MDLGLLNQMSRGNSLPVKGDINSLSNVYDSFIEVVVLELLFCVWATVVTISSGAASCCVSSSIEEEQETNVVKTINEIYFFIF